MECENSFCEEIGLFNGRCKLISKKLFLLTILCVEENSILMETANIVLRNCTSFAEHVFCEKQFHPLVDFLLNECHLMLETVMCFFEVMACFDGGCDTLWKKRYCLVDFLFGLGGKTCNQLMELALFLFSC